MTRDDGHRAARRRLGRWIVPALLAASAAIAEVSSARCDRLASAEFERICERGELRVASFSGEPSAFIHRDGDDWDGFDVDLARDIAARLGVRLVHDLSAVTFDDVVERVAAGEVDLAVSKISVTLERAQLVRFTDPYVTVYQALLINRVSTPSGGDQFERLDAPGVVVGALDGGSYIGFAAAAFERAAIRPFDDLDSMMAEVLTGSIDAAMVDSEQAATWRREHRAELVRVRTWVDKSRPDRLAIAVRPQDTHLLAWLNVYLRSIREDGTAERFYDRWFAGAR